MIVRMHRSVFVAILFLVGLIGGTVGSAVAGQPLMWGAKHALITALNDLQQATANKGGHRVNAINLVQQAIGEVNAGIAAGAGQ